MASRQAATWALPMQLGPLWGVPAKQLPRCRDRTADDGWLTIPQSVREGRRPASPAAPATSRGHSPTWFRRSLRSCLMRPSISFCLPPPSTIAVLSLSIVKGRCREARMDDIAILTGGKPIMEERPASSWKAFAWKTWAAPSDPQCSAKWLRFSLSRQLRYSTLVQPLA